MCQLSSRFWAAILSPEHSWFHHFVGGTLLDEPPVVAFNWIPLLTSFVVAFGGLGLGYLMYWRKPLVAGEPDPLIGILGERFHNTLKNKYYVDELYVRVFVTPSQWFSRVVVSQFIERGIIDGILDLLARVFTWIGDLLKLLNVWLIDGVGDGIAEGNSGFWALVPSHPNRAHSAVYAAGCCCGAAHRPGLYCFVRRAGAGCGGWLRTLPVTL